MKLRSLLFLLLILLIPLGSNPVYAQGVQSFTDTLTASRQDSKVLNLTTPASRGVSTHTFLWNTTGTVSAGACALLGSADNITFGTTVIAAQTVTSSGGPPASGTGNVNYVKISCTTPIMGSGSVYVIYFGTTPVSGGGAPSGTGAATQVTYWTGVNTIAGDTGLTYNSTTDALTALGTITGNALAATLGVTGATVAATGQSSGATGVFTTSVSSPLHISTQGSIGASAPYLNHTATWTGGGTFTDHLVNITNTSSNANSLFVDYQVGGATQLAINRTGQISKTGAFITGILLDAADQVAVGGGGSLVFNAASSTTGLLLVQPAGNQTGTAASNYPAARFQTTISPGAGAGIFSPINNIYTVNASGAQSGSVTGFLQVATETNLNGATHNLMDLQIGSTSMFRVSNAGRSIPTLYGSQTNCADSAGAAACAAAPTGAFVMTAGGTTVTVSTTAVTANSRIFIQEDPSLATELGITCNTTIVRTYGITTRTAATSFVVTASAAPAVTDACLSYWIIN